MKIRAQIAMVLNLDKCIGCHTCSVTCKNVWTSRKGMEYAWFNNVETKPGIGYPKDWENQERWKGGWERKANGKLVPKQGGRWAVLAKIFANPHLPEIDDYYEPFTFDYENLQTAPELPTAPVARPISLVSGRTMDKVEWGPNWEEILGGEFDKRSKDYNFEAVQKDIYGQFENTFMMYLPRLCEHCLNPTCVASCPSTVCSETCVGRIRYLGVLLYDADRISDAAGTENPQDLYEAQLDVFLDPFDPEIQRKALEDGVPAEWIESAQKSPAYKMAVEWKIAFPLHPEYRTLPMVWYVPPLSPISAHANSGNIDSAANGLPDVGSLRIPVRYLANLLTAGHEPPIVSALERMLAMRAWFRGKQLGNTPDAALLSSVGLDEATANDMHRYLAIANYEDRFVIPTAHREEAENAYQLRGGCGFTFGNGCDGIDAKAGLFGGKMGRRKVIPIRNIDDHA